MNPFLTALLGTYGPIAAAFFPVVIPALDEVTAAVGGQPVTVPALRLSWKGKHIEIGPFPIKIV